MVREWDETSLDCLFLSASPGPGTVCTAGSGSYSPGIRTSTSCCPLLSLHSAASVKTPHAPCINAVIRNQYVKREFFLFFFLLQPSARTAQQLFVFKAMRMQVRWPVGDPTVKLELTDCEVIGKHVRQRRDSHTRTLRHTHTQWSLLVSQLLTPAVYK